MNRHLTPTEVCERLIGDVLKIGVVVGFRSNAVTGWKRASRDRDAGDVPSSIYMRLLLDHSDRLGLGLTAEHLIRGANAAEIDAILEAREMRAAG